MTAAVLAPTLGGMRERLQTLLPSVLALTLVTLLYAPVATLASSGLPATITMYPEAAGPGELVEITGLDFPGGTAVELQLTTTAGTVHLASATTAPGGDFRELVTLPADAAGGHWELEARAADGSIAAFAFDTSGSAPVAVAAGTAEGAAEGTAAATTSGNSTSDIVVMLVIAVVLGAVAIAGMFAWRQVRDGGPQAGMGAGDDLIWSGDASEAAPELTATDEPFWKAAQSET